MATTKVPKWLSILRFAPIIIQLIDDIFIEVRKKDPETQDPLFATKMRLASLHDQGKDENLDSDRGEIPPPF